MSSNERIKKILSLRLDGLPYVTIGEQFGITKQRVAKIIKDYQGLIPANRRHCLFVPKRVTAAKKEKAVTKMRAAKVRAKLGRGHNMKVTRKCAGCKLPFSAREMRTHPCPSGMSYWKRAGMIYDKVTKRYVWPTGV